MNGSWTAARQASFALLALGLLAAAHWGLGPCLLAGLFAYLILEQTEKLLRDAGAPPLAARASAVVLFVVLAGLLSLILASFVHIGLTRLPAFLDRFLPRVEDLADKLGVVLPVDNVSDLRQYILDAARGNARAITAESGVLTRGFFQILVAIAAALAGFLSPGRETPAAPHLHSALSRECGERAARFWASFTLVAGAQVLAAAVNAGVTGAFLFAARVPFRIALILATFLCGMVPVAGVAASGALIVAAALTASPRLALIALIFLLVWHKLQYFVSGRIVGARLDMPLWAMLVALLAGEAFMGVTGLILAPALLHYGRAELRAMPAETPS